MVWPFFFSFRCRITRNVIRKRKSLVVARCSTKGARYRITYIFPDVEFVFIIYIPTIRKSYDSILKIRLDLDMNRKELNISDFSGQFENCKSTFTLLFKLSNLITSPLFQFQNSSTTISIRLFLLSSSTDLEFFVKRNILQGWPRIPI